VFNTAEGNEAVYGSVRGEIKMCVVSNLLQLMAVGFSLWPSSPASRPQTILNIFNMHKLCVIDVFF